MRKTLLALSLGLLAAPAFAETGDIVETATGAGSFTTLLTAAEAAGLVDTLKGDGPFTVFAPTDAAFAALPEGTVEDLLKPENKEKLTEILTYHVVPGEVMSSDLTEGMTAETVEGGALTVTLEGGPKVNGVSISQPDVDASNGVIHVIDGVLMPGADRQPQQRGPLRSGAGPFLQAISGPRRPAAARAATRRPGRR